MAIFHDSIRCRFMPERRAKHHRSQHISRGSPVWTMINRLRKDACRSLLADGDIPTPKHQLASPCRSTTGRPSAHLDMLDLGTQSNARFVESESWLSSTRRSCKPRRDRIQHHTTKTVTCLVLAKMPILWSEHGRSPKAD